MGSDSEHAKQLRTGLARMRAGETGALNDLIALTADRLRVLARRMLRDYPRVRRWADTDDVLQNALIRLCRALEAVPPATPRDFFALAATQLRRELLDLVRRFTGPEGSAANHESRGAEAGVERTPLEKSDLTNEPGALADWSEFHEQVATLPEEQREVFGLIFYQGMTQDDAADVLGVALRTVQRRWQSALLALHRLRKGERPGM